MAINLKEAEAIGKEATEAPWGAYQDRDYNFVSSLGPVRRVIYSMDRNDGTEMVATDKFIAYARNHWQEMIDELRELRKLKKRK